MEKPQYTYTPHYETNQLICGNGQVAIVTGWTPRNAVAKKLNPDKYAVIGNLYSPTKGISPLMRNLLANPHVWHLVILDATKEDENIGGCQVLRDFFHYGFRKGISDTGKPCWIITSDVTGYIDIEIKIEGLSRLWDNIKYFYCQSIDDCIDTINGLAEMPNLKTMGEPLIYPDTFASTPTILPDSRSKHGIEWYQPFPTNRLN